jgi:hypothetical protein
MADSEVFFPSKYAGRHNKHGSLPCLANTKYPRGTMVARDGDGRAARPGAGLHIHGISEGDFDNTATGPAGVAGANDAFNVELAIGVATVDYSGTAPKAGQKVYAVDNHTVSLDSSSGTRGIAGVCTETGSGGKVEVYIDPVMNGALAEGTASAVLAKSLTLGHADLNDADGSQSFNIGTALPAGAVVLGCTATVTEAFTDGATGDFDLDIGIAGAPTSLLADADLSLGVKSGPLGARPLGRYPSAQLLATVRADVNVTTATAGAAVIEVFYAIV